MKMKDVDMAVLQSERAAGVSLKDLAEKYGVTDGTICYWLKKARKATEPTASEDFGAASTAIMESREKPEPNPEPMQLGPWNAHECGDMPSGVSIILDTDGEPTMLIGATKVRRINLCPWCGVRLVKEA